MCGVSGEAQVGGWLGGGVVGSCVEASCRATSLGNLVSQELECGVSMSPDMPEFCISDQWWTTAFRLAAGSVLKL
jgi:hypothetical protein